MEQSNATFTKLQNSIWCAQQQVDNISVKMQITFNQDWYFNRLNGEMQNQLWYCGQTAGRYSEWLDVNCASSSLSNTEVNTGEFLITRANLDVNCVSLWIQKLTPENSWAFMQTAEQSNSTQIDQIVMNSSLIAFHVHFRIPKVTPENSYSLLKIAEQTLDTDI